MILVLLLQQLNKESGEKDRFYPDLNSGALA